MATLTGAGQGNSPANAPNSPGQRGCGKGWMDRSTPGCPSSHDGWIVLGQTALVHSTSASHGTLTTTSRDQGQNSHWAKDIQEGITNRRGLSSLQCFRCQGWGHMAWACPTPAKTINQSMREPRECSPTPLAPAATANSRPPSFPPWPQTKTDNNESSPKDGTAGGCPSPSP